MRALILFFLATVMPLAAADPPAAAPAAGAGFGVSERGGRYVVDSGAGLVFEVDRGDGSIRSIRFRGGPELQDQRRFSHLGSGYGPVTSTAATIGDVVLITCRTGEKNSYSPDLTHYFMVRRNVNLIYMATYVSRHPGVGETRWITRFASQPFPHTPVPSDTRGTVSGIEANDVGRMADGTSRSKYYGDTVTLGKQRAIDLTWCGIRGPGIGGWMIYGNRESSSGGPFYRDIQNQSAEVYNYMNSGHAQTEPPRTHVLHGPYALGFTDGRPPGAVDFSWIDRAGLGLRGYVPAAGRGEVRGRAGGVPAPFQAVVGFANAEAQYWAVARDGRYHCPGMKPGTYRATLFKRELEVATGSVTVAAGRSATLDLVSTERPSQPVFRIGEWDGTPAGFLNSRNLIAMHPSDPRQHPWGPVAFTVGRDGPDKFPAILASAANSPARIRFDLTPEQVSRGATLRVGITVALHGARPRVAVNGRWTSRIPEASPQPDGRSYTVGTYRGRNHTFEFRIPPSALSPGPNTLAISPVSGSRGGGGWFSPGFALDCIELE